MIHSIQGVAYGIDGIFTLDVDFLVGIVYQMMDFAPISVSESKKEREGKSLQPVKGNDPILKEVERVLTSINEYCPGQSPLPSQEGLIFDLCRSPRCELSACSSQMASWSD